VDEVKAAFSGL